MSDTQQNRATLSRNFIAQQSCLSDIASCPTFDWMADESVEAINKALLLIMSSSVLLETSLFGDCLPMENWQLPMQLYWATKLRDKVAQLCCVSDIGLRTISSRHWLVVTMHAISRRIIITSHSEHLSLSPDRITGGWANHTSHRQ